ncbi:nerve growth factor-like protein precursor [Saccoglossus kowalevskii]|uniref:Nerve growth factor-like protein n=1 Tax=Saccoglossus kowalevskii TaxID=10224 RepID=D1LX76_SACKO|nr:nerve growth factor-like protein precursor [Saccoglossus kowalevskii]ACY92582.1 nerve growth factor-like protein [Saccoglossus kowalevskii]
MNSTLLIRVTLSVLFMSTLIFHNGLAGSIPTTGISKASHEPLAPVGPSSNLCRPDNGMLQLVLHDLTERMIWNMQKSESTELSELQIHVIRSSVNGFYKDIKDHPAINSDRVMFAPQKPDLLPDINSPILTGGGSPNDDDSSGIEKRNRPFQEVCRSSNEWIQLTHGSNEESDLVEVYQNQWFHVTRCRNQSSPCTGIAEMYTSRCKEKQSWTNAYVKTLDSDAYSWQWISITTCCTCVISEN